MLELDQNLLVDIGGWPALKEARALVERGRVSDVRRDGAVIRARVQGAEKVYDAQITLADRVANIEVRCTCAESRRSGRVCAHALAAGLALLKVAGAGLSCGGGIGHMGPIGLMGPSHGVRRLPTAPPRGPAAATTEAATMERPRIIFGTRADGALELNMGSRSAPRDGPARGPAPATSEGNRVIPRAQIADFLSREFPALERSCELVFAPGSEEFRLEIGRPAFEARLEGALSGLTVELIARYQDKEFSLNGKTESSAYQRYVADAREPNRFWRRNILAEREALAQVEAAGFGVIRSGAAAFSLISENQVARFLANTLPRWRRAWTVRFGPRLEATMAEIDVAQPEFSLRRPGPGSGSGENWLSLDLKLSVRGKPIPLDQAEIQRWLQTGQSHARMTNKRVLLVPTEAWSEMKEVLADCEVEQEPGKIRVARTFAPFLAGALTAQGFRTGENVAGDVAPPDVKGALDEKLWAQLRPYQAHGVEWLAGLAQQNLHGLLADDMGLGKTLQALAFCAWVKRNDVSHRGGDRGEDREDGGKEGKIVRGPSTAPKQVRLAQDDGLLKVADATPPLGTAAATAEEPSPGGRRLPTLVVCPTSLVTNWLREAARFTPELRTLDLTGPDRAEKFGRRKEYDLLVTSYAILRRDIELYRADEFSLVILDEAQHIKNRGSQNAQSAKALRARRRLILTGTPLENSVLDLWSLFDFLLPGYLGTAADFKERYETPLTRGLVSSSNSEVASCRPALAGRSGQQVARTTNEKLMERLRHRVRPFFLRRTKEEVLTELPPKLEHLALCELTDEQREVYRAVLEQGRREVFEHSGKADQGRDRIAVLTTLLRLRQVCCHLDLLPGGSGGKEDQISKFSKLTELGKVSHGGGDRGEDRGGAPAEGSKFGSEGTQGSDGHRPPLQRKWKEPSAKMERTFELIDEAMDGGHRVLLFSQFVRVLHLLRDEAVRREIRFCYLDGQTVERQAEVDRFQNDAAIPLFFISLKAGGTGLNLTGADTVIHFDPWWNPAVEEQATSRAHRMGQARSVQAYKLIAAGTVEEKIQALQARKRELFEASMGGDEAFVERLSGEELEELLAE